MRRRTPGSSKPTARFQGSGKGTHAKMLVEDFDLEHLAAGDIFRWNVQHHTKLGAQIRRTMAAGSLVGDDLVEGVVGYGCASTTGTTASSSTASPATSGRRSSSWRATTSTG